MISSTMMPDATPANTDRRKEYADNRYTPFLLPEWGRQRGDYIIFFQKNPCKSLIFHVNSIEEITASNDDFYGVWITFIYYCQISVNII